jgi:hypothetical protein
MFLNYLCIPSPTIILDNVEYTVLSSSPNCWTQLYDIPVLFDGKDEKLDSWDMVCEQNSTVDKMSNNIFQNCSKSLTSTQVQ